MQLTPSFKSSYIAGIGLWAVIWSAIFKLDSIAKLFKVERWLRKDRVVGWMEDNKILTLLGTEFLNFGVHGVTNPNSTTFALGGTTFNTLIVFGLLPIRKLLRTRKRKRALLTQIG